MTIKDKISAVESNLTTLLQFDPNWSNTISSEQMKYLMELRSIPEYVGKMTTRKQFLIDKFTNVLIELKREQKLEDILNG